MGSTHDDRPKQMTLGHARLPKQQISGQVDLLCGEHPYRLVLIRAEGPSTPVQTGRESSWNASSEWVDRPRKHERCTTALRGILGPVRQPVRRGGDEVLKVARGATPTHEHLRLRLALLFIATAVLDVVASLLIYLFERHAEGTEITTIGDSVFWTSTQLLTVSSQLPNPISTPARVLDVFLQAYAISVVAILAGSFGAFFHRRGLERDPLADSSPGS